MLHADGGKTVEIFIDHSAIECLVTHPNRLWPRNCLGHAGHGDAAFRVCHRLLRRMEDLGVYIVLAPAEFWQLYNHKPFQDAAMRCGNADSGCRLHCFVEILGQCGKLGAEVGDGVGGSFQGGIGIAANGQSCHVRLGP